MYNNIITYSLGDNKILFFDIFARNGELILIVPPYNNINEINVFCENTQALIKKRIDTRNQYYIVIYYDIVPCNEIILEVKIHYYNIYISQTIEHKIFSETNKYNLIQTTLFKDDFYLLSLFVDYYLKQGVEHFYLYYNGKLSNLKIPDNLIKDNITFIEWDYKYYISGDYRADPIAHAQPAQLIHSLLKYGKFQSEYILFNDLDEYTYVPNKLLKDIVSNNEYDTIVFHNNWSDLEEDFLPSETNKIEKFPSKFLRNNEIGKYPYRSKCIHKSDSMDTLLSAHGNELYQVLNPKILINNDYIIFHFYRWIQGHSGHATRNKDYIKKENMYLFELVSE